MSLEDQKRRGQQADMLLKNPLLQAAIDGLRERSYRAIRTSKPDDVETRDIEYLMLRTVDLFEKQLIEAINGGKKAELRLLDRNKGDE